MTHFVLCIGDPHFQEKNMSDSQILVQKILELIAKNNFEFVVVLGDLLHTMETFKMFPYNLAITFLKKISKLVPLYFIVGNHERIGPDDFQTENHPYIALDDYKNIKIVSKAEYITINNKNYFFVPYVPNGKFFEALLTTSANEGELLERFKTTTAIFGHQEFRGCQTGAVKSTKGDIWPLNYPLVISGHIHTYEALQTNILYTGTPQQIGFDDSCDKTVSQFIFSNVGKFEHKRIDLEITKKKIIKIDFSKFTRGRTI